MPLYRNANRDRVFARRFLLTEIKPKKKRDARFEILPLSDPASRVSRAVTVSIRRLASPRSRGDNAIDRILI